MPDENTPSASPWWSGLETFHKRNPWALPGAVIGALGGAGTTLFSPQFSWGDFLRRLLMGGLFGGGLGYGIPKLRALLAARKQQPEEIAEEPVVPGQPPTMPSQNRMMP